MEKHPSCGVYTLKYIECLVLGCKFDGLSDKIIQDMRLKLAAEIFDEMPEPCSVMCNPLLHGEDIDEVELITKSKM
ncbi:unnamed protein product [Arabis nemorensis]|uniref:Ubiquitin-like protease family profile domain-containing protein n=1 Tax=Arabis nemorensis TaxID=586526 RepID=A0A565CCA7_9BRAS|nr:unnamed protein product [Arabis nemorensis]